MTLSKKSEVSEYMGTSKRWNPLSIGIHFKLTPAAAKEKVGVLPLYHLAEAHPFCRSFGKYGGLQASGG